VRKQFEAADQVPQVEADIRLRKALDFLVSTVEIVDEDGNPIDRADLEISDDDDTEDDDSEARADDAASVEEPTEHEESDE
jgi:hypothetical protein